MIRILTATTLTLCTFAAVAAPVTYEIDSDHTHPTFEVDHMGGLSVWRGIFDDTKGKIVLDTAAQSGSVDVTVKTASIDLGQSKLEEHVRSADFLDVAKYPTATYQGKLAKFVNGAPTEVQGTLTLHGISKPLTLHIRQFLCKQHPMKPQQVCGADAIGNFDRADFGIDFGKKFNFQMWVKLAIQIEALRAK
jgi:polyisoprenoid-binding protein YceI